MKLQNKSKYVFQHTYFDDKMDLVKVEIGVGEVKDIDDEIAKIWLKTGEIVEFIDPKQAKEEKDELLKEVEKLKAENKKLKNTKTTKSKK